MNLNLQPAKRPLVNLRVLSACLTWYFVSSLTSQSTKYILNRFPYPIFIGEFQFLCNLVYGYLAIRFHQAYPNTIDNLFPRNTFPEYPQSFSFNKRLARLFLPMGSFQFIGKLFSLAATTICSVATVASIRALSPLLIVTCYKTYYRVHFGKETYLSLFPLLLGVILILYSQSLPHDTGLSQLETSDDSPENVESLKGMSLALIATLIFAVQNIYAKNVVTHGAINTSHDGDLALATDSNSNSRNNSTDDILEQLEKGSSSSTNSGSDSVSPLNIYSPTTGIPYSATYPLRDDKPSKMTTLIYCALFGFVLSIPTLCLYEIWELTSKLSELPLIWLAINGFCHFIQSLMAFQILSLLPTVSYSIAAMMKRIVIITISMLVSGKGMNVYDVIGLMLVVVGLYSYDRWGSKSRRSAIS